MQNYIEAATGFTIKQITLKELYDLYNHVEIQPYSVWLQRLKQESKWSASDWVKARSYLYRLFSSGKTSKTMFTVVDINLLIQKLTDQIQFKSDENIISAIFQMMIEDLGVMKSGGCKLVLLDGQNRLEYPIKKFFDGTLQFYLTHKISGNPKSINFVVDDKRYAKEAFLYKDLKPKEKDVIDDIQIILAIGGEGEIDEFIEDLMDDNSGESWNEFEMMVTTLRTVNYLVNGALSKDAPKSKRNHNIPSFKTVLDKTGKMDGAYHPEKKGLNKFLLELIQYDYNGNLKLDYGVVMNEANGKDMTKAFDNVKEFFNALTRDKQFYWTKGTKKVFATKEHLRNMYAMVHILKSGAVGYKISLDKILSFKRIYEDYGKFDNTKRDRVVNFAEFVKTNSGDMPLPNTWIWAQKDIKLEVLTLRKTILTAFIEEHIEQWIDAGVFKRLDRDEVTPSTKKRVILDSKEDPYSAYGQELNQFVDDIHVDHKEQFGRGGSNDVGNLVATTAASNLSRVK